MFITAVCIIFLIKLRWPKNKSLKKAVLAGALKVLWKDNVSTKYVSDCRWKIVFTKFVA